MRVKSLITVIIIIVLIIISLFIISYNNNKNSEIIESTFEGVEYKTEKNYLNNYTIYDDNGEVMFENIEESNLKFYQDNPDYEPIDY